MANTYENSVDRETPQRKGHGYTATIIGADVGFILGGLLGFVVSISWFDTGAIVSFTNLAVLFAAIVSIAVVGAIGGVIGTVASLSIGRYPHKGRTALFLALLYPIPLLLAGSDLFIGALILPLLARWLALRNW